MKGIGRLVRGAALFLAFAGSGGLASGVLSPSVAEAAEAPNFTLRDLANKEISLTDYRGKVVMISFWATWCGPCKVEMKHLHEYAIEHADEGLEVLSITIDEARTKAAVKPYIKKKRYNAENFHVLYDSDAFVKTLYAAGQPPYSVLIGRDGEIVKTYTGYQPGDEVALHADIKEALAGGGAPTESAPTESAPTESAPAE